MRRQSVQMDPLTQKVEYPSCLHANNPKRVARESHTKRTARNVAMTAVCRWFLQGVLRSATSDAPG